MPNIISKVLADDEKRAEAEAEATFRADYAAGKFDADVPEHPDVVYKERKAWAGWVDWVEGLNPLSPYRLT